MRYHEVKDLIALLHVPVSLTHVVNQCKALFAVSLSAVVEQEFSHVAVVSMGEREPCEHQENIDVVREDVRSAAAGECFPVGGLVMGGRVCCEHDQIFRSQRVRLFVFNVSFLLTCSSGKI